MGKLVLVALIMFNALIAMVDNTPLLRIGSVLILMTYAVLGVYKTEFPKIGKDD